MAYTYDYDADGNITAEYIYTDGATGPSSSTATNVYTYGDSNWKDKLTAYKGQAITYDQIGNPLTYRDGITMTWQNGRQLATLTQGDTNISYRYDSNSIRTSKTVNGVEHTYAYLNGKLMYETRGNAKFYYSYDANGALYSVNYTLTDSSTMQTYYYTRNAQGDIIGIYDSNGTQQVKYMYDAWGSVLSVTDDNGSAITDTNHIANLNPFRYRGYYYDSETGFYYLMTRYYDPVTHRFINADGYFQAGNNILCLNMSAYCGNNPITRIDPTGEIFDVIANVLYEIGKAFSNAAPTYAGLGGVALTDGPLPFGDCVALGGAVILTVVTIGRGIYQATQTKDYASSLTKEETDKKDKDIPIYRYYASKNDNLWPRYGKDYDCVSFNTKPPSKNGVKYVVTTINAVNSTGILKAYQDIGSHVCVIPVNGTVEQWMNEGQESEWTKALSSVVLEWDGG